MIELLVVVVIIGILAAIAIPAFFNQRNKASDSGAKEMAHTSRVAMEALGSDNDGSYSTASPAAAVCSRPYSRIVSSSEYRSSSKRTRPGRIGGRA